MRVRVLLFGVLKDLAEKSNDALDLPEGALVRDALAHCIARSPKLKESMASLAVAVNHEYAGLETMLQANDEVALLPPVSGGSGKAVSIIRDPIDTRSVLEGIKRGEDGAA